MKEEAMTANMMSTKSFSFFPLPPLASASSAFGLLAAPAPTAALPPAASGALVCALPLASMVMLWLSAPALVRVTLMPLSLLESLHLPLALAAAAAAATAAKLGRTPEAKLFDAVAAAAAVVTLVPVSSSS